MIECSFYSHGLGGEANQGNRIQLGQFFHLNSGRFSWMDFEIQLPRSMFRAVELEHTQIMNLWKDCFVMEDQPLDEVKCPHVCI